MPHSIPIRIYFEDTDAGGVVYHASYLKFAERGRTELLRFLGFENKSLQDNYGILFVVRHLEANYIKTAHLDDMLELTTVITALKNASVTMKQSVFRDQDEIFSMNATLVCIDRDKLRPVPIPPKVREGFAVYHSNNS